MECKDVACSATHGVEAECLADLANDPTLADCCRRDLEEQRRAAVIRSKLQAHDRVGQRLAAYQSVVAAAPPAEPQRSGDDDDDSLKLTDDEEDEHDPELDRLRRLRLGEMQRQAQQQSDAHRRGAGQLHTLQDREAAAWLLLPGPSSGGGDSSAAGGTGKGRGGGGGSGGGGDARAPRVLHCAERGLALGHEVDEALSSLAARYWGSRFARCELRAGSPLPARLGVPPVDGIVCFIGGKLQAAAPTRHFLEGGESERGAAGGSSSSSSGGGGAPLTSSSGGGDGGAGIDERRLERWLKQACALRQLPGEAPLAAGVRNRGGGSAGGGTGRGGSSSEDEQDEWQQPCEVCGRRYPHEHVGRSVRSGGGRSGGAFYDDDDDEDEEEG